jgi:hypothetical protein
LKVPSFSFCMRFIDPTDLRPLSLLESRINK